MKKINLDIIQNITAGIYLFPLMIFQGCPKARAQVPIHKMILNVTLVILKG